MSVINLRIQSLEDVKKGIPLFEGMTIENTVENADVLNIGILEHGTVSGQTTIIFAIKHEEKYVLAEITANQFNAMQSAFKGAEIRFKEEQSKKN